MCLYRRTDSLVFLVYYDHKFSNTDAEFQKAGHKFRTVVYPKHVCFY